MATVNAKKPAGKPVGNVKPPAGKAAAKPGGKAAPKAAAPKKDEKPYDPGQIVVFKGYSEPPPEGTVLVAEGTELAVVSQRVENGQTFVACVAPQDYHKYMANPDAPEGSDEAVDGSEYSPSEIKRTTKTVEEPFALVAVGDYEQLASETPDLLERGQLLYSRSQEMFFYFGGTLAELWKGKADDDVTRNFATYDRPEGAEAPADASAVTEQGGYANTQEGFVLFLEEQFPGMGGKRKAFELIGIYEAFSALPNAAEVVAMLGKAGWWKAGMVRGYVTNENAVEVVQTAIDTPVAKLSSVLKETYVTEDGNKAGGGKQVNRVVIKKSDYKFQLYEDRGTGVNMILDAAKKQLKITDDNALFEHIITEWAGTHLGSETVSKAAAATERKTDALKKQGAKFPEGHPAHEAAGSKDTKTEAAAPAADTPKPAPTRKLPSRPKAPAQAAA